MFSPPRGAHMEMRIVVGWKWYRCSLWEMIKEAWSLTIPWYLRWIRNAYSLDPGGSVISKKTHRRQYRATIITSSLPIYGTSNRPIYKITSLQAPYSQNTTDNTIGLWYKYIILMMRFFRKLIMLLLQNPSYIGKKRCSAISTLKTLTVCKWATKMFLNGCAHCNFFCRKIFLIES